MRHMALTTCVVVGGQAAIDPASQFFVGHVGLGALDRSQHPPRGDVGLAFGGVG
jgi:hypothetical protein